MDRRGGEGQAWDGIGKAGICCGKQGGIGWDGKAGMGGVVDGQGSEMGWLGCITGMGMQGRDIDGQGWDKMEWARWDGMGRGARLALSRLGWDRSCC